MLATLALVTTLLTSGAPRADVVRDLVRQAVDQGRMTAIAKLQRLGTPEALRGLCEVTERTSRRSVLERALGALDAFDGGGELRREAVEHVFSLTRKREPELRLAAVESLVRFGEAAQGPLRRVVESSKDPACRAAGCRGILDALADEGTPEALWLLMRNARLGVTLTRPRLLGLLDRFRGEEVLEALARVLRDRRVDAFLKAVAVDSLAGRPGDLVDDALRQALRVPSPAVQYAAARALLERDPEPHMGEFLRLSHSDDPSVQRVALVALGRIRSRQEGWEAALLAQARRNDPVHRQAAAPLLAELAEGRGSEALMELLVDPDRRVRAEALEPLVRLRPPAAVSWSSAWGSRAVACGTRSPRPCACSPASTTASRTRAGSAGGRPRGRASSCLASRRPCAPRARASPAARRRRAGCTSTTCRWTATACASCWNLRLDELRGGRRAAPGGRGRGAGGRARRAGRRRALQPGVLRDGRPRVAPASGRPRRAEPR